MKPRYSVDKKAPRMGKGKFSVQIVTKELWRTFKRLSPEYKNMTWDEFYKNWQDIAETIRTETVTNPLGIKLGSYTGELKLQYLPYKFESVDHKTSEELGTTVNHVGLVTRGKNAKIKWERRWAVKFNKMLQFYAFDPTRDICQLANLYIEANPEKLRVSRNTLGGFSVWRQLK